MSTSKTTVLFLITLLASLTASQAQYEPYNATGCTFLFTLGHGTNGAPFAAPPHATITCIQNPPVQHDPNGLCNTGHGDSYFTYCDGDLLVVQCAVANRAPAIVGCVMSSGPARKFPGHSKNIVMPPNTASATFTLKQGCDAVTGNSCDAICGSGTSTPYQPPQSY